MFKEYVQFLNRLYDINWFGRLRLINSEVMKSINYPNQVIQVKPVQKLNIFLII